MGPAKKKKAARVVQSETFIRLSMPFTNQEPFVAIIILNWNRWHDTVRCLESVFQSTYTNYAVILVDNGSRDGSVEKILCWAAGKLDIHSAFFTYRSDNKPLSTAVISENETGSKNAKIKSVFEQLTIITNNRNYGFAKGNNIGIQYALKRHDVHYVMLLNNDTIILPDCMQVLVTTAEEDTRLGSCQPKMLSMEPPGRIDTIGISMQHLEIGAVAIGNGLQDTEQFSQGRDIFGVCAGAALYRKVMLDQIGLFDEDFFAYYEDVDLAFRARLKAWRAVYVPRAIVYHGHSATLGKESPVKTRLHERNRYYYIIKCAPFHLLLRFLISRPFPFLKNLLYLLRKKKLRHAREHIRGNIEALVYFPKFFFKRLRIRASKSIDDNEIMQWFGQ
jgi:GT2 family glycosyltransferase